MRRSWGSNACRNLAAMESQHRRYQQGPSHDRRRQERPQDVVMANGGHALADSMMMDDTQVMDDEWGYFVDTPSQHPQHLPPSQVASQW